MPTACAITRGTTMLLTMNQPMRHDDQDRDRDLRLGQHGDDHRRRPRDERPEERDHLEDADEGRRGRQEVEPEDQVRDRGDAAVDEALDGLAADEAAERGRDARLEQPRRLRVARRHEPVDVGQDPVLVEHDEQRQEDDQQQVADDADAEQREIGQRPDERIAEVAQAGEEILRGGDDVDLEAEVL